MPEPDLILASDVGTTNVKAAVVDKSGELLQLAHRELIVEQGDDGRAEHNPDALFAAFSDTLREASRGYEKRIALIVPATYQMALIAVDKSNEPVTGMMTLLDTRARNTQAQLMSVFPGTELYDKTGCPPVIHFPLPKLFWLKTKRPELLAKTHRILSCKDYLLRRLANVDLADTSVSSTTQYMNIDSLTWNQEILGRIGVSPDLFPPPASPETIVRDGLDSTRKSLGLPNLTGILLGAYDGGAVGIGLGGFTENTGVMNFGTTAMLRHASAGPSLSTDGFMRIQSSFLAAGKWIPGGAINNAGAVLRWLRDNVFNSDYHTLTAEAKSIRQTDGLLFLPYLSGERSIDIGVDASGSYFGLRTHHKRGHLVRAAFEGVAFSLRRVKETLVQSGFSPKTIRVGSGGAHSAVWMDIVASVLGIPLQTTRADEPGLLGSALLGYTALGEYSDVQAAGKSMIRRDKTYNPDTTLAAHYDSEFARFNYLTQQMKNADDKFAKTDRSPVN
jgi:gluconokinase